MKHVQMYTDCYGNTYRQFTLSTDYGYNPEVLAAIGMGMQRLCGGLSAEAYSPEDKDELRAMAIQWSCNIEF